MTEAQGKRIVLIGLGGVDWPSLGGAMKRGWVPGLSALAGCGAIGALRTLPPLDGPQSWVSLATGRLPETHGVIAQDEAWAGGIRAASRASWAVPAIWERMEEAGIATASVGWPAAAPGADWPGLHVDESYAKASGRDWSEWPMPLRCAPAETRAALRELRVHPTDIEGGMLAPLIPALDRVDQERDPALVRLALAMAEASTVQAAAKWLLDRADRRAIFIHYRWLDIVRAGFEARSAPYEQVVEGGWRFLDGLAVRLADLAGPDALVVFVSPGRARDAGLLLAVGPEIPAASGISGAGVLDIAPTLLAHYGLADPQLPGRALAPIAEAARRNLPPSAPRATETPDAALLAEVVRDGYSPPLPPPPRWRAARLGRFGTMLLPRAPEQALAAADAALAIMPDDVEALSLRAFALIALERPGPLLEIADALERVAPHQPWGRLARGAYHALVGDAAAARPHLLEAEAAASAETRLRAGAAWLALHRPADAARAFEAALAIDADSANAEVGLSMALTMRHRLLDAEAPLRRVIARDPAYPAAWVQLATVLHLQGREREAVAAQDVSRRLA